MTTGPVLTFDRQGTTFADVTLRVDPFGNPDAPIMMAIGDGRGTLYVSTIFGQLKIPRTDGARLADYLRQLATLVEGESPP